MKIYVASSWRNKYYPSVIEAIRKANETYDVYDFRNPKGDNSGGFGWSQIDPNWQSWTVEQFQAALAHPIAEAGFALDKEALESADVCILVLPSGMSAHLEAGFSSGRGKELLVYAPELKEAELMYKLFDYMGKTPLYSNLTDVITALAGFSVC